VLIPVLIAFTECWLGGNMLGSSAISFATTCSLLSAARCIVTSVGKIGAVLCRTEVVTPIADGNVDVLTSCSQITNTYLSNRKSVVSYKTVWLGVIILYLST